MMTDAKQEERAEKALDALAARYQELIKELETTVASQAGELTHLRAANAALHGALRTCRALAYSEAAAEDLGEAQSDLRAIYLTANAVLEAVGPLPQNPPQRERSATVEIAKCLECGMRYMKGGLHVCEV